MKITETDCVSDESCGLKEVGQIMSVGDSLITQVRYRIVKQLE